MTSRDELEALAARVEALTGPCRETDVAIARAFGRFVGIRKYTASLDAAMTLVPEGWRNWISDSSVEGFTRWMLRGPRSQWVIDEAGEGCAGNDWYQQGIATTPALALTAASLRALAAQEQTA